MPRLRVVGVAGSIEQQGMRGVDGDLHRLANRGRNVARFVI
jgi:hypothetical protein